MIPSPRRSVLAFALVLPLAFVPRDSISGDAPRAQFDVVELVPQEPPKWSPTNVFAPITGFFHGGPGYWYGERAVEIETTPPGAVLDLFYVRRNFQKRYEQADAPVRVILPRRIEASERDTLTVRALLDGYRQREIHIPVRSKTERVMIDLSPLPNSLLAFAHPAFAGRGSLIFQTKEALTFRLQKSSDGFDVVLAETASTPEADATLHGVGSSLVAGVQAQQLGEDLMIRVRLTELGRSDAIETRSRQGFDPVRGLHVFAVDLAPRDGDSAARESARQALGRISAADVTGCALEFDARLRDGLEPDALARALTPNGSQTDPYLRAAMKRLGEVSPEGVIRMRDGSRFRGAVPIELMAAATQPQEALGYLSLLRRFVAEMEAEPYRTATLHGLIAPELAPDRFAALVEEAETVERACGGTASGAAASPS
jgi:hypothetical protein